MLRRRKVQALSLIRAATTVIEQARSVAGQTLTREVDTHIIGAIQHLKKAQEVMAKEE
jgi:hypothetical protein